MGSITLKMEGIDKLKQVMSTATPSLKKDIENTLIDAALSLQERTMKNLTDNKSVRTGTLVKSFGRTPEIRKANGEISVIAGTDVEYAPYVEYGTSRMPAKPYFNPAFEETRSELENTLKELVG